MANCWSCNKKIKDGEGIRQNLITGNNGYRNISSYKLLCNTCNTIAVNNHKKDIETRNMVSSREKLEQQEIENSTRIFSGLVIAFTLFVSIILIICLYL